MNANGTFSVFVFPEEATPRAVYLMGLPVIPLRYLCILTAASELGDRTRPVRFRQVFCEAAVWSLDVPEGDL